MSRAGDRRVAIVWSDGERVTSSLASFLAENPLPRQERERLLAGRTIRLGGGAAPAARIRIVPEARRAARDGSKRRVRVREYEGVEYHPYRISYVTTDGRRRTKTLYAPGDAWVREAVDRWIHDADVPIKRGSNVHVARSGGTRGTP